MGCVWRPQKQHQRVGCVDRASPALKEMLLKLYSAKDPLEIDHHFYEFGSVEYHITSSASDSHIAHVSISTPLICDGLSDCTVEMIRRIAFGAVDAVQPPKQGYQITLRLDFEKIPGGKGSTKVLNKIAEVQALILSSQLKEMLRNVNLSDNAQSMPNRPIKLAYHPREPFYVIKQFGKITVTFPIRFRDRVDGVIATSFFQELADVGNSKKFAKAPQCSWSPIPPPELRGESFQDLSTNGGFVSFDISSRHVEGRRLDKTVWCLLNFYTFVKRHVKATRAFIQRRMRKRLQSLVRMLKQTVLEDQDPEVVAQGNSRCRAVRRLVRLSRSKLVKQRCGDFTLKMKRSRCRVRVGGSDRLRQRWFSFHNLSSSSAKYTKLD